MEVDETANFWILFHGILDFAGCFRYSGYIRVVVHVDSVLSVDKGVGDNVESSDDACDPTLPVSEAPLYLSYEVWVRDSVFTKVRAASLESPEEVRVRRCVGAYLAAIPQNDLTASELQGSR